MVDRLTMLLEMLQEDPKDSFVLFAIAKEYEKQSHELAIEHYVKLKKIDPDYVGLYYHLGKAYEEINQLDNAIETYTEGINIGKKQADFHAISELNTAKTNLELEM